MQTRPQSIKFFKTAQGICPYWDWYHLQEIELQDILDSRLVRVKNGNFGDYSGKGLKGIFELILDHGPGYRIYFGKEGLDAIRILGAGKKRGQQSDIDRAQENWKEFNRRPHGMR